MISVVIPAYNEAKILPETLRRLALQEGSFETIVADGGSTDGTPDIALRWPAVQLTTAPKGRASQMNDGGASRKRLDATAAVTILVRMYCNSWYTENRLSESSNEPPYILWQVNRM